MQSIIETLFYDTVESPKNKEKERISAEETKTYEELSKSLTNEQKQLLITLDDLKNEHHLEQEKDYFTLGFQAGAQALLEMLNLRFPK